MAAVIFSFFNTLVRLDPDAQPHERGVVELGTKEWGQLMYEDQAFRLARHNGVLHTEKAIMEQALLRTDRRYDKAQLDEGIRLRRLRYAAAICRPEPRILAMIKTLHAAGHRLALCANADILSKQLWKECPLTEYFKAAVFSCVCGSVKPEKEIYLRAAHGLRTAPPGCLFVGGGEHGDLKGAKNAGMRTVRAMWYPRQNTVDGTEADFADFSAQTPAELCAYLCAEEL
jgi:putative hydrolase of the HAD superfamily